MAGQNLKPFQALKKDQETSICPISQGLEVYGVFMLLLFHTCV